MDEMIEDTIRYFPNNLDIPSQGSFEEDMFLFPFGVICDR